jgi:hypothetical protein
MEPPNIHTVSALRASKDDYSLPRAVQNFRDTIEIIKRKVYGDLETKHGSHTHDLERVDKVVGSLISMGNQLMEALKTGKSYHQFSIQGLTPEERDLCMLYVHIDIYMNPYDLNGHAS